MSFSGLPPCSSRLAERLSQGAVYLGRPVAAGKLSARPVSVGGTAMQKARKFVLPQLQRAFQFLGLTSSARQPATLSFALGCPSQRRFRKARPATENPFLLTADQPRFQKQLHTLILAVS